MVSLHSDRNGNDLMAEAAAHLDPGGRIAHGWTKKDEAIDAGNDAEERVVDRDGRPL